LLKEGGGRFVLPKRLDRIQEGATFERMEQRGEFLDIDATGRYGLTKDGILNAAATATTLEGEMPVVVVDASVGLVKKMRANLGGARLIGVWVALDTLDKFKERIQAQMDSGAIIINDADNDGNDKESITRAKLREIVQEIEYGVVSGIFEFTILNDDIDTSFAELQEAAEYCFK
jgi:guanylate kinase